jgi:hypothetical protein
MWWTKERDVVERLCRFPMDFRDSRKNRREFVEAAGILKHPSALLTVESLLPYLKEHPELVGAWLAWSAGKLFPRVGTSYHPDLAATKSDITQVASAFSSTSPSEPAPIS